MTKNENDYQVNTIKNYSLVDFHYKKTVLADNLELGPASAEDLIEVFQHLQALSGSLRCDEWVECLTQIAIQIFAPTNCALVIINDKGEKQVRSHVHGLPVRAIRQPLANYPELPCQMIEWTHDHQQSLLFEPRSYANLNDIYLDQSQPAKAWSIPLLSQNQCLGVIYLEHQYNSQAFTAKQQQIMELLISHAAVTLLNVKICQQLQKKSQQTRRLFEAASDAILLHTEQKVLDCNPAALRLFGMSRAEFLATNPRHLSPQYQEDGSESASHAGRIFGTLMAQGHNRFEWQHQRPNGETFWAEVGMTLLEGDDGGEKLMHCVVRDIGDRKKAEADLKQTYDSLALANMELEKATRLKDEFLANMSHELRTPLNAILGMAEALQEQVHGSINKSQARSVEIITRSGHHLLNLINDILDVSKIAAGKVDLDLTEVSIAQLCITSLVFVKQQAFQKQIKLEKKLLSQIDKILVDERRIQQVLINLLSNAVKFTPAGGQVSLEVLADDQTQELMFAVRDTGIGIKASDQERLFTPFIQIDSQLNRKYEGTGLGLALVKQIVELHGGRVTLQSAENRGSCFTVHLPLQNQGEQLAPLAEQGQEQKNNSTENSSASRLASPRILLVEDNESNIQTMASYLSAKGYDMILARDGYEAIQLNQEQKPQIVLMDIQMPGMDGFEAIQKIRTGSHHEVPILALTALAMAGDRARCLAAGANDYLAKPVKLKELDLTIQQWLNLNNSQKGSDLN